MKNSCRQFNKSLNNNHKMQKKAEANTTEE